MSSAYKLLYGVGFTPWERMASLSIKKQISGLFGREEIGRRPPYGKALDLGCGSGIWAVELAARGWRVTGVDFVAKALRRARERVAEAGVEVRLIEGDVTALGRDGVGSGFDLLLDFGCFHDELSDAQREQEGRAASAVAAPGANLLLLAWTPGRRGPLPRGASREQIESAFSGWRMIDDQAVDVSGAPRYVRRADPRFYRLRNEARERSAHLDAGDRACDHQPLDLGGGGLCRQELEALAVTRADDAEVTTVGGDQDGGLEALRQRHERRIGATEREVRVLIHELADPHAVDRRRRFDLIAREAAVERGLTRGPEAQANEICRFRDRERAEHEMQVRSLEDLE